MSSTQTKPIKLELTRTLKAPVEKVFKAWTEPKHMSKWFGCAQATSVDVTQDLRVGGDLQVVMNLADGRQFFVTGTFLEIVPNEKLVFTWSNNSQEFPANDTLVSVKFLGRGDSTEIMLEHSKFPAEKSAEGHTFGWTDALEKLALIVE